MSWPSTDFEVEIQDKLDRYEAALQRIVEIGEDESSNRENLLHAFKIADEALNPTSENIEEIREMLGRPEAERAQSSNAALDPILPKPRPLQYPLAAFHEAPSGVGPLAAEWKDKPHRLIYDLLAYIRYAAEQRVGNPKNDLSAVDLAALKAYGEARKLVEARIDENIGDAIIRWDQRVARGRCVCRFGEDGKPTDECEPHAKMRQELDRLRKELDYYAKEFARYMTDVHRSGMPDTYTDYVPVRAVLDICEKERVYWNRRSEGGDLLPSPNDASDGWAAAENIAYAVKNLMIKDPKSEK